METGVYENMSSNKTNMRILFWQAKRVDSSFKNPLEQEKETPSFMLHTRAPGNAPYMLKEFLMKHPSLFSFFLFLFCFFVYTLASLLEPLRRAGGPFSIQLCAQAYLQLLRSQTECTFLSSSWPGAGYSSSYAWTGPLPKWLPWSFTQVESPVIFVLFFVPCFVGHSPCPEASFLLWAAEMLPRAQLKWAPINQFSTTPAGNYFFSRIL